MKAIVTGVAGFVGSSLAKRLLELGLEVVGIDCLVDYYDPGIKKNNLLALINNSRFSFIQEDLNKTNISKLLDGAEWVFHQAGQAGVRASWGDLFNSYTENNINASQKLLEGAKNSSIKKFIYASSSSIYGNAESFPTPEDVIPKPVSPYGVTKLAAEHLMTLYYSQFSVPTVSLRYFTVFGPKQRPDMAFHRFIRAGLLNEKINIYGDGFQSRDFTYIDDIVEANILAAQKGEEGSVYNLGGGIQATVNDVLEILKNEFQNLNITYEEMQKGDAMHTKADTQKARARLGFDPKVNLKTGLLNQIEWMKTAISLGLIVK